jgi:hypothetical protein
MKYFPSIKYTFFLRLVSVLMIPGHAVMQPGTSFSKFKSVGNQTAGRPGRKIAGKLK